MYVWKNTFFICEPSDYEEVHIQRKALRSTWQQEKHHKPLVFLGRHSNEQLLKLVMLILFLNTGKCEHVNPPEKLNSG